MNPKIQTAMDLICKIYTYNEVGSNAHIVLDDHNIEDSNIRYCLDEALQENPHESSIEQLEIERECLETLLQLTEEERLFAVENWRGYVS